MRFGSCLIAGCAYVMLMSIGCQHSSDSQNSVIPPSDRFVDKGNGTVMDTQTGLVWLKHAGCLGARTWTAATAAVNALTSGQCGLTDGSTAGQWRLPKVDCSHSPAICDMGTSTKEFETIMDSTCQPPIILNTAGNGCWTEGNPFYGVRSNIYWSSTTLVNSPGGAWYVDLADGTSPLYIGSKSNPYYVWPVRGGP